MGQEACNLPPGNCEEPCQDQAFFLTRKTPPRDPWVLVGGSGAGPPALGNEGPVMGFETPLDGPIFWGGDPPGGVPRQTGWVGEPPSPPCPGGLIYLLKSSLAWIPGARQLTTTTGVVSMVPLNV